MNKNVIGLFDNASDAQATIRDLNSAGFNSNQFSLVANNAGGEYGTNTDDGPDAAEGGAFGATTGAMAGGLAGLLVGLGLITIPGVGPVATAGTLATTLGSTAIGAGLGAAAGGLIGALVGAGIPEEDAQIYAESVRRGGSLLTVSANSDQEVTQAIEIMRAHNVVDIDNRAQEYRSSGWTGYNDQTSDTSHVNTATSGHSHYADTTAQTQTTLDQAGEMKVPVIEEELRVGKQQVEGGGVRVYTRVEEQPVSEQVTLRQEHVDVHRKAVDRPVSDADLNTFQEGTVEVRTTNEHAVVEKQARVVEEVHIKKDVEEHTETIQDTVRRTDVEVEQIPGQTRVVGDASYQTGSTYQTGQSTDEGTIERGASKLGNSVERGLGADLDNDGDVGQRDPRNNI